MPVATKRFLAGAFSVLALVVLVGLTLPSASGRSSSSGQSLPTQVVTRSPGSGVGVDGMGLYPGVGNEVLRRIATFVAAKTEYAETVAAKERAAAEAEAERVRATPRVPSYAGGGGGACGEMMPAGFDPGVVSRESGGDPGAVNSSSGASGCAQILPEHFSPDGFGTGAPGACVGLSYEHCWERLWDGGAGASHWACTPESGCG